MWQEEAGEREYIAGFEEIILNGEKAPWAKK